MAKFFCFENSNIVECESYPQKFGMGVLSFSEAEKVGVRDIDEEFIRKLSQTKYTSYERKKDYQYIVLNTPATQSINQTHEKILIYLDMRGALVFSENGDRLSGLVGDFAQKIKTPDLANFLSSFLLGLLSHDYIYMEGVEKDLGKIETEILSTQNPNFPEKINSYRKKVSIIKRYYEQLYEVCVSLSEEEFLQSAVADLEKIKEKVKKLREDAMYLRDYMSQIREAYQQGVDLSLNATMKFLSAVTLLFSPLTFLVGWYGMNFDIPESKIQNGYIIPIVLAVVIIAVSVWVFKRKKWF